MKAVHKLSVLLFVLSAQGLTAFTPEAFDPSSSAARGVSLLTSAEEDFFVGEPSMADLRRRLDHSRRAFQEFRNSCEREYWTARALFFEAMIDEYNGQRGSAEARYLQTEELASRFLECSASASESSSSEARRLLADTYSRLTKYRGLGFKVKNGRKIKSLSESAIRLDDTNSKAYLTLALYYLHAPGAAGGSAEKSIRILREIEEKAELPAPERYSILLWLAIAYSENDESTAAEEYLQRAFRMYPKNGWVESLLRDYGL